MGVFLCMYLYMRVYLYNSCLLCTLIREQMLERKRPRVTETHREKKKSTWIKRNRNGEQENVIGVGGSRIIIQTHHAIIQNLAFSFGWESFGKTGNALNKS